MNISCHKHGSSPATHVSKGIFCSICVAEALSLIKDGKTQEASIYMKEVQNFQMKSEESEPRFHIQKPYLRLEYWDGKKLILLVGACVARSEIDLADVPLEISAYSVHAMKWLENRLCFPNNDAEMHIDHARLYCLEQGPGFIYRTSSHLWNDLKTDYIHVLSVMDS